MTTARSPPRSTNRRRASVLGRCCPRRTPPGESGADPFGSDPRERSPVATRRVPNGSSTAFASVWNGSTGPAGVSNAGPSASTTTCVPTATNPVEPASSSSSGRRGKGGVVAPHPVRAALADLRSVPVRGRDPVAGPDRVRDPASPRGVRSPRSRSSGGRRYSDGRIRDVEAAVRDPAPDPVAPGTPHDRERAIDVPVLVVPVRPGPGERNVSLDESRDRHARRSIPDLPAASLGRGRDTTRSYGPRAPSSVTVPTVTRANPRRRLERRTSVQHASSSPWAAALSRSILATPSGS